MLAGMLTLTGFYIKDSHRVVLAKELRFKVVIQTTDCLLCRAGLHQLQASLVVDS